MLWLEYVAYVMSSALSRDMQNYVVVDYEVLWQESANLVQFQL